MVATLRFNKQIMKKKIETIITIVFGIVIVLLANAMIIGSCKGDWIDLFGIYTGIFGMFAGIKIFIIN